MIQTLFALWRPALEIAVIWYLVHSMLKLIQGTRAMQILSGLIVFALLFQLAKVMKLDTVVWLFTKIFAFGMIALVVIFHPELRRALERFGQNTFSRGVLQRGGAFDEIIRSCEYFSKTMTGALIVIERETGLKNIIETGTKLDAAVSEELLRTIFLKGTALHDGAVIVQGATIASAGSLLPLTQRSNLARDLGTRHRAAIGMSEETDAVCIILSEETGKISVAVNGKLTQNLDTDHLRRILRSLFVAEAVKGPFDQILKGLGWTLNQSKK